jgi:hypothetical protein
MNKSWKWAVGALALAVVLTGCGTKEEATAEQPDQVQTQGGAQQGGAGGGGQMGMGMQADLMGKVKSIEGQTITVYKSNMTFGGGRGQGDGSGQPPAGDRPQGEQPPAGDRPQGEQPPEGEDMPEPPADGEAPQDGGGRMNMDNMFSEETMAVQVTDATKIISVTFENNEMVEKAVALADLKADDILSINLKDDTMEAESITLRTGAGGFGGGGGRQRPNDQQQQTESAK